MLSVHQPLISVLMPVYNGEKYIEQAIRSILTQTYTSFELIIVNDGSTDTTESIVKNISDHRICYISHKKNLGLANIRNKAIGYAKGEFLAWLDSDDFAQPCRLAQQVEFLLQHPNIALVGSWATYIRPDGSFLVNTQPPNLPQQLTCWLLFMNCFVQSSVMVRKSVMQHYEYDSTFPPAEDYDLWAKIAERHTVANLPAYLVSIRRYATSTSQQQKSIAYEKCKIIAYRLLQQLGITPTAQQLDLHLNLAHYLTPLDKDTYQALNTWLALLQTANHLHQIYDTVAFDGILAELWFKTTLRYLPLGSSIYQTIVQSPFCKNTVLERLTWRYRLWKYESIL